MGKVEKMGEWLKNRGGKFGGGRGDEGPLGGKGALIHKFTSLILLVNILKCCVSNLIKITQ